MRELFNKYMKGGRCATLGRSSEETSIFGLTHHPDTLYQTKEREPRSLRPRKHPKSAKDAWAGHRGSHFTGAPNEAYRHRQNCGS
jgi:hypothetical protein